MDRTLLRLRWAEIALFVTGISLLGAALYSVLNARIYQARQVRAFSEVERRATAFVSSPSSSSSAAPSVLASPAPGADPLVLGMIEIPRIGVSAIVREGDDDPTLAVAVGHIPGTARPGESGNMGLAGHRDTFFRALERIKIDDVIRFRASKSRFEYRVEWTGVVGPDQTHILGPTDDAVLTLVTCYPFRYVGHAPHRFIVRARLRLP
jgi:sortase A